MKGLTMKQKWAMHKRGTKPKGKSKGGSVKKAKKWVKKQWGLGRIIAAARVGDALSRPVQIAYNWDKDQLKENIMKMYTAGLSEGEYNSELLQSTYGEIGTSIGVNAIKSKAGVYKGAGRGKILSILQAVSPEFLAATEIDPRDDIKGFNNLRREYDAGGTKYMVGWDLRSERFMRDKLFNVALGVIQKVVFNTNGPIKLNAMLPKWVNF